MSVDIEEPGAGIDPAVADHRVRRNPVRFAVEAAIGGAIAAAVALAVVASTGEIPFVYQGY